LLWCCRTKLYEIPVDYYIYSNTIKYYIHRYSIHIDVNISVCDVDYTWSYLVNLVIKSIVDYSIDEYIYIYYIAPTT
jgi:hypothetical protein